MSRNQLFGLLAACAALLVTLPGLGSASPRVQPAHYSHQHHGHGHHWRGHHARPRHPHGKHGRGHHWRGHRRHGHHWDPATWAQASRTRRATQRPSRARSRLSPSTPDLASCGAVTCTLLPISICRASTCTLCFRCSDGRAKFGFMTIWRVPHAHRTVFYRGRIR